jgi:bla regulator protein BlaR1
MNFDVINSIHLSALGEAVCKAFAHSLWQGLVFSLVAGMIMVCTRKKSAAIRYNLLVFTFFSFLFTIGYTFYRLYASGVNDSIDLGFVQQTIPSFVRTGIQNQSLTIDSYLANLNAFIEQHVAFIMTLWSLVFLFKLLQLSASLYACRKLLKTQLYEADAKWHALLEQLAGKMFIRRTVRLFQSASIRVPMVIGHTNPVILFPLGALSFLSEEEVEAILIHELSHIRRMDYLLNLILGFVDCLLFFNPAIRWISSLIRIERESCCDDAVIGNAINPVKYIEVLVRFQSHKTYNNTVAMGLTLRKAHLLTRAKRMLNHENQNLNTMEKSILLATTSALLILGIANQRTTGQAPVYFPPAGSQVAFVPKQSSSIQQPAEKTVKMNRNDTTVHTAIIQTDNYKGDKYQIKKENNTVVSLVINGNPVDKEQFSAYSQVVAEIESMQKDRWKKVREDAQLELRARLDESSRQQKIKWDKVREDAREELKKRLEESNKEAELKWKKTKES